MRAHVVAGVLSVVFLVVAAPPVAAQPRREPRGFVALSAGAIQSGSIEDRFTYELHVEQGTADVSMPASALPLLDFAVGRRVTTRVGLALAVSHASGHGDAEVDAQVPHPLFDEQHRRVEGNASGAGRTQTAAHLQVYFEPRLRGRTRLRLFAGPSIYAVRQELAEHIDVSESYPFDSATLRDVRFTRAKGTGIGAHAGLDVSWLLSRRLAAGVMARYGRASVDLNGPGSRSVSSHGGGAEVGAGLRLLF